MLIKQYSKEAGRKNKTINVLQLTTFCFADIQQKCLKKINGSPGYLNIKLVENDKCCPYG